jgi:hypothetical protein
MSLFIGKELLFSGNPLEWLLYCAQIDTGYNNKE